MVSARQAPDGAGLIDQWSSAALHEAQVKWLDEEGYSVSVPAARGAWACEPTVDEAMVVLKEVLVDWVTLKLADRDDDIPSFGGIGLQAR